VFISHYNGHGIKLVRPLSTVDYTRDYARVSHSRQWWSNYIVDLKRHNRLKVGTNRPKLTVKMQLYFIGSFYLCSNVVRKAQWRIR